MNLSAKINKMSAESFVKRVSVDYSQFKFVSGDHEHWSPRTQTITYNPEGQSKKVQYGILHELAHALLEHTAYSSDFELLKMESVAWQKAARLGLRYGVKITDDHIQNCLDTYRDWLHRRSKCPTCNAHGLQVNSKSYRCINCRFRWQVSPRRFARPYRLGQSSK